TRIQTRSAVDGLPSLNRHKGEFRNARPVSLAKPFRSAVSSLRPCGKLPFLAYGERTLADARNKRIETSHPRRAGSSSFGRGLRFAVVDLDGDYGLVIEGLHSSG